jgi:hypothetical protein
VFLHGEGESYKDIFELTGAPIHAIKRWVEKANQSPQ